MIHGHVGCNTWITIISKQQHFETEIKKKLKLLLSNEDESLFSWKTLFGQGGLC